MILSTPEFNRCLSVLNDQSSLMSPVLPLSQAVVYEKPGFEGSCLEIDSDVFSFCESEEGGISADGANLDSKKPKSVGSLKIIGGL